jgi:exodeoxyribonuclease V alpha subunit
MMQNMNNDYITTLYNSGNLSKTDILFANFIANLNKKKDPEIILAAALVSSVTGNGDICLDLGSVSEMQVMGEQNIEIPVRLPKPVLWQRKLRQSSVVGKPGEFYPLILDEKNRLYLYRYWEYEKIVAESIKNRINETVTDIDASVLKDSSKRFFSINSGSEISREGINWQKVATMTAAVKKFCVISGGPGTGKTYTVAKILSVLLEQKRKEKWRIFLCAPTGKAAVKLSESIKKAKQDLNCIESVEQSMPLETYTIHRMLNTIPGSPYFRYHAENLLPADVVIVDEASMIDLALMSKLVSSIPLAARLILIGDRNQLASVEAGSVLGDICNKNFINLFSREYCQAVEEIAEEELQPGYMHDPEQEIDSSGKISETGQALYDCIVVLKKSLRFAVKSKMEGLSQAVNAGDLKEFLSLLKIKSEGEIQFESAELPKDNYRIIAEKIVDGYSTYLKEKDPVRALERFNQFKLLCALRLGPYGTYSLNRLAEEVLQEEKLIQKDFSNDYPWYRGRPILITKNDYSLGLFNGDIGITMPDPIESSSNNYVFFSETSGGIKRYSPYRIKEHETAYAMTVHKSQGSEFDHVCLVFPDKDYPLLTRELVYTGITRARRSVLILGNEHILKSAVSRGINRTSGLKDSLWDES